MPLFTVIANYGGGTYISQVSGKSQVAALQRWSRSRNVLEIQGVGKSSQAKIVSAAHDPEDGPVQLTGLDNIWCFTALIRDKGLLINLVQTDPS